MCGITGYVGDASAIRILLQGLENLEYRGYDSAGIALQSEEGLDVCKRAGEVATMADVARDRLSEGILGIGHTRWSTHGPPTDANAHPHTDCKETVAVVHNGIIDNQQELRDRLRASGHEFESDTDTEVIPHLVEEYLAAGCEGRVAFERAMGDITGSYAVAMILDDEERLYASRSGSPLVLGVGSDGHFISSDVPAFLKFTEDVVYLEDGDIVTVEAGDFEIRDTAGVVVKRPVRTVDWTPEDAEKGGYDHYMLKEIHEQPTALERTVRGRLDVAHPDGGSAAAGALDLDELPDWDAVHFVACGTSYHAARYGEQLLANRGVRAVTTLASEFVANTPPLAPDTLVVGVTQSGETADTLEALRAARASGHYTLALTNVVGSTAARECDDTVFIRAGPEIGVAATKTFSSQVVTLALLADHLANADRDRTLHRALEAIPSQIQTILDTSTAERVATIYRDADAYFFVGRGVCHPVALEGALKLKEISYEHAEGFPAGELKHGPLALVTPETPVIAILSGAHGDRMEGTIREVSARGAPIIAVGPPEVVPDDVEHVLAIPETHPELAGILANVQLQLLSYHTAALLDRPVDKPRNLAKSVTVE